MRRPGSIARAALLLATLAPAAGSLPHSIAAAVDRAPWTGDPTKPQAAPAPPRGAPSDAKSAIAERHRRRDAFFKNLSISPFTAAGVHPIAAHVTTRAGADDAGLEIDPNTTKPDVVSILLDDTGVLVAPVSGGEAIRVRHRTGDGDAAPGAGDALTGPRRLTGGDIVALGRFLLVIAGNGGGGDVSVFDPDYPARRSFEGFRWFDPDPNMQVRSILSPIAHPDTIKVATSDGQEKSYCRFGTFDLDLPGARQTLTALASSPSIAPGATLFIPFRDATNGHETYANGRYLEIRYEGPGKTHLLDFNRAINPYCNYSPWYSCPIPPKENTLAVPIRAGEMAYPHAP